MTAASLIGFGVVFVLVCVGTSALFTGVLLAAGRRLARRGPAVERWAAELVAIGPVLVAAGVTGVLVVHSMVGPDHCTAHHHHAHLCVYHGAAWADLGWAVAIVVSAAVVLVARLIIGATAIVRGRRLVSRLHAVSRIDADGVHVIETDRVFCFVAGIRPSRIYASTAARAKLTDDEWRAMLAHEASHVRNRDLGRRAWIDAFLMFAAPLAGPVVREHWDDATERLRDSEAAEAIGAPESVASALVQMCRHATQAPRATAAFTPRGDRVLSRRVEALLGVEARGEPIARALGRRAVVIGLGCLALAAAFSEPLHHALETLLG